MSKLPELSDSQQEADQPNPALLYLDSLAPSGCRSMRSRLKRVANMFDYDTVEAMPWGKLDYEHIQELRAILAESLAPASVNATLSALRGALREAWRSGQISRAHYQRACSIQNVDRSLLPTGRHLETEDLAALMRACGEDRTPVGARDAAIVALAYAAGLRRNELASLQRQDLHKEDSTMVVRIVAREGEERLAYINNGALRALEAWLQIRGQVEGALFWRGRRGGHLAKNKGLSGQAIRDIVVRRAEEAQIGHVTPNDLRRTFMSDLLAAGVDSNIVAEMAGHESAQPTKRYDPGEEAAKRHNATRLKVPYYD